MSNQQPSMFDGKGLAAIFLVGIFFIFWQNHLAKKYKKPATEQVASTQQAGATNSTALVGDSKSVTNKNTAAAASLAETTLKFDSDNLSFEISSLGMGIKNAVIKSHTDRKSKPVVLSEVNQNSTYSYSTNVFGRMAPLNFAIQKKSDTEFVGTAEADGVKFFKSITVDANNYKIDVSVEVEGAQRGFTGVTTILSEKVQDIQSTSVFMPQFERQEFYFVSAADSERVDLAKTEDAAINMSNANIAAISSHYFTLLILDKSSIKPSLNSSINPSQKSAEVVLNHKPVNYDQIFRTSYVGYLGPKSLDQLSKLDSSLVEVINFGWFSALARPILRLMQWFYGIVSNWGVAIILLTILVRLLILPLHIMSYRSMEGMKRIQPILTELREKYKSNPQRLNQEMLTLMRTHKVNPVGGCLPMLLQFPVFLALYQVLGQSIELYQAPFIFWISDLSLKDPFYVLPVLMSLAMFLQMKLTPSTLDPTQQKIMTFMPIIFGVFTLALPSGLTLYIFISSLFGIIQQMYFMRDQKKEAL